MGQAAPRETPWDGAVEATAQARTTSPLDAPTVARTPGCPRPRGHRGWIRDRTLDPAQGPHHDPTPFRGHLPCALPLAPTERVGVVYPGARDPGSRTRRGVDPGLARPGLATRQKKARRRGAVIVFIDETGFSYQLEAGTTWAPRGQTPVRKRVSKRRQVSTAIGLTTSGEVYQKHGSSGVPGGCSRALIVSPLIAMICDGRLESPALQLKSLLRNGFHRNTPYQPPGTPEEPSSKPRHDRRPGRTDHARSFSSRMSRIRVPRARGGRR
jgi:hypothetical protein